jgi:hypothetical protein
MTSVSHESLGGTTRESPTWAARLLVPELWAFLAIAVMWLAVLFSAIFGPDIETMNGVTGVGQTTTVPSAVAVALFAFLGTWVVARHGFRHERTS